MTINSPLAALSRSRQRDERRRDALTAAVPAQRTAPTADHVLPGLSGLPLAARVGAVVAAWAASLALSTVVTVGPGLHDAALGVHLLSLVVGFGAVVMVEWHGVLWFLGKRGIHECSRLAAGASPLIWLGVAGLLASGALLGPDLTHPPTQVKLALVLLLGINGALLSSTRRALALRPPGETITTLPRPLLGRMLALAAVSQGTWWGAAALGFLATAGRM